MGGLQGQLVHDMEQTRMVHGPLPGMGRLQGPVVHGNASRTGMGGSQTRTVDNALQWVFGAEGRICGDEWLAGMPNPGACVVPSCLPGKSGPW